MPSYTITTGYTAPAPLDLAAHRTIGATVEAAAVAQLRLSAGFEVPPSVADALALLRAWHARTQLPIVPCAAIPEGVIAAVLGGDAAIITNVGD